MIDGPPLQEGQRGRSRSDFLKLIVALVAGKLAVFLAALYAYGPANFLHNMSTRWDSAWFLAIA